MPTVPEETTQDAYDFWGNRIENWLARAQALHFSHLTLRHQRHLLCQAQISSRVLGYRSLEYVDTIQQVLPELILAGYKVELLLKARFLRAGKSVAADGRYVGPRTHNLVELANDTKFELDNEEESLLEFLSTVVVYLGRYPISTRLENERPGWRWGGEEEDCLSRNWSRLSHDFSPNIVRT